MWDLNPNSEAHILLQTWHATDVLVEIVVGFSFAAARFSSLDFCLVCSEFLTFLLMVVLHEALSAACLSHVLTSMSVFFRLAFKLSLYLSFGLPVCLFPADSSP